MQLHFIHAIKGLNLLFCRSVLSLRCVWCDASGLAQGTRLQNNVDTEKPDRIRVWRSSWQKEGELQEEEQQLWPKIPAEDKKRKKQRENWEAADCEWLTWTCCVLQSSLLLPVKCLLTLTSPLEKDYNLSSLSFEGLRPAVHFFTSQRCWSLNRGRLQPPSACAMSLSPAAPCCGLCSVSWQHLESLLPLWVLTGWWDSPAHPMPSLAPMGPPQPEKPTDLLWASTAAV